MYEGKRIRRTPEQIVADLDVQIENLKDSILELERKTYLRRKNANRVKAKPIRSNSLSDRHRNPE